MSNIYDTFPVVRNDEGHQQLQQQHHIYDPNLSSAACYSPNHHYNTNDIATVASASSVPPASPAISSAAVLAAVTSPPSPDVLNSSNIAAITSVHNADQLLPQHCVIVQSPTSTNYQTRHQHHHQAITYEPVHTGDNSQFYQEYHTDGGPQTVDITDRCEYRNPKDRLLSGDNQLHITSNATVATAECAADADVCELESATDAAGVGNAVDLQLPTVEDAELLYGLYGSAFRYDDYDDVNDVNGTVDAGLAAGLRNDEDEAAEMLTTLLDHRPSATAEMLGHHACHQLQELHHQNHQMHMQLLRQQEEQHQRALLEMAMMPLCMWQQYC